MASQTTIFLENRHMLIDGPNSGFQYDTSSAEETAQYIIDVFVGACQIGHDHSYYDIYGLTPDELIDMFCPDFIIETVEHFSRSDLIKHVEEEMKVLQNRLSNEGGQAISISDYAGQEVDRILLEKALDFMISLDPDPSSPTAEEDYRERVISQAKEITNAENILRQFGKQINPLTLDRMQDVYYSITNSAKYRNSSLTCCVVRVSLNNAWNGIGNWAK